MIHYFQIKKREEGRAYEIYYREKVHSRSNNSIVERYISTRKPVIIEGDGDSGKTRSMMKMFNAASKVWRKKPPAVLLSSIHPLLQWVDHPEITSRTDYSSMKQHQRVEALIEYCQKEKPVIFVDDAHKLTGRKLQIAKSCIANNVFVMTTLSTNRLPPSIREMVVRRNPQTFSLKTQVAYDATAAFGWFFVVMMFSVGMPEVALLAGGFQLLSGGRKGSNNA